MIYRYLITETVKDKIKRYGLSPRMLRELRNLEESEEKLYADEIHSTRIILERRQRHGGERVVWFEDLRQEGLCLYVLREIYLHDEYKKELSTIEEARKWERKHEYDELEELEIKEKVDEIMNPNTDLVSLPQEWYPFEEKKRDFSIGSQNDIIVYESKEWIEEFSCIIDKTVQEVILQKLREFVSENNVTIWSELNVVSGIGTNEYHDLLVGNKHITMRLEAPNGDLKAVYLLSISENPQYEILKSKHYHSSDFGVLQKRMKRCYPGLFLLDKGPTNIELQELEKRRGEKFTEENRPQPLWLMVEHDQDGQATLILSPEETYLLSKAKYPFFINGLAGSGKSTLLYYLFACVYYYQHQHYPNHSLLFLSYSDRLVKKARSHIAKILKLNPEFMSTSNIHIEDDLDDFVKSFSSYLRTHFLTDEERKTRFSTDKRIDYDIFRKIYQEDCRHPNLNISY